VNSARTRCCSSTRPTGQWYYSDDCSGSNPAITFANPQPGLYDIWIGAYGGGRGLPGQLVITER
jgi:hypothetical protein